MKFWKYQVNGNDFILMEEETIDVERLCYRFFGIGADGILVVHVENEELNVQYWNADGTAANFCGNGICCVMDWYHRQFSQMECEIVFGNQKYQVSKVEGSTILKVPFPQKVGMNEYICGVKHVMAEDKNIHDANENYVEWIDEEHLMVETFELGVGWTNSCGSGNIVSFYHWYLQGLVKNHITCMNPGGNAELWIEDEAIFYRVQPHLVYLGQIVS